MPKLLFVVGPTATGKTVLAIKLAKKFNGELVSADSRQIYQGLDIGTGKDVSKLKAKSYKIKTINKSLIYYDLSDKVKLWLTDLITPKERFSVSQYLDLAWPVIKDINRRGKLPIVVGGTGLYIRGLLEEIPSRRIKPRPFLRLFLNRLRPPQLRFLLKFVNRHKLNSLNNSDRNNPRRLIRAIEISLSRQTVPPPALPGKDALLICLYLSFPLLKKRIEKRIKRRLSEGQLGELKTLLAKYSASAPGLNTISYQELIPHLKNKASKDFCLAQWKKNEIAYARRQLLFFKKFLPPTAVYIDTGKVTWKKQAFQIVRRWYTKKRDVSNTPKN